MNETSGPFLSHNPPMWLEMSAKLIKTDPNVAIGIIMIHFATLWQNVPHKWKALQWLHLLSFRPTFFYSMLAWKTWSGNKPLTVFRECIESGSRFSNEKRCLLLCAPLPAQNFLMRRRDLAPPNFCTSYLMATDGYISAKEIAAARRRVRMQETITNSSAN